MQVKSYNKFFFLSLISRLNKVGLKYAIVGDYNNLPESVGHDIDVWTDDVNAFRKILYKAIQISGCHVLIDNRTANGCNVVFYKREGDELTFMKVDVMVDTAWKSVLTLIDSTTTRKGVRQYKDFYVMGPEVEALGHFLYPMFEWGFIKKNIYKKEIKDNCRSNVFQETFTRLWGEDTACYLISLIEAEKWDTIKRIMPKLKRKAFIKGLFKLNTWKNIFTTIYYIIRRWMKPSGKCIAFCGLDGAGKTTILDELNAIFINILKRKKVYYGYWRPFVLPEIRELFGKKNSKCGVDLQAQKGVTVVQSEKEPKNMIVSLIKLMYYWTDYLLSPLKLGGIHSRGGIILFDRHYVDMAVHPQRFEMRLPRWLILLYYKFIPKADYTFFLYCTPDEILQRKQEFTKVEIEKQIELYNKVGRNIKNFIPIHTNTTVAKEIDEILLHIAK